MVKKKGGYARKNKQRNAGNAGLSRPLVLADEDSGQRYARVLRALGDGRFSVVLCTIGSDGAPRAWNEAEPYVAVLPGRMRRRRHQNNVAIDSVIAVTLREYASASRKTVDVAWTYTRDEMNRLLRDKLLPNDNGALGSCMLSDVSTAAPTYATNDASNTDDNEWNVQLEDAFNDRDNDDEIDIDDL
jgi:translation initiation factor IF-1